MYRLSALVIVLISVLALPVAAELSVSARFNPPRIAVGDRAQYIVEITESSAQALPEVERLTSLPIEAPGGLQLLNGRTSSSQSTRIINGQAEYSVTQQVIVDAQATGIGTYTVPAYNFQYKAQGLRVPAATLTVVERAADAAPAVDELILLETNTPDTLYVGQSTAIELKLYVSENVRLNGLNRFDRNADGFTVSELPDSKETVELKNGRRYRVLTWPLTVTPIQTGEQALNFQFDVSATIPGQDNRSDPFGRPGFGNSLFDSFFGRSQQFTVYNKPTAVDVRPLPAEDQPASFSGAIGDFAMEVYTDLRETRSGEPIMLSLEIAGQGNFERIGPPTFPETDDWRSYQPESTFQPRSENDPLRGTKRFDYVLIPAKSGTLNIPSIDFSYFDVETGRYAELNTPPIPITVRPGDPTPPLPRSEPQAPVESRSEAIPLAKELSMEEALLTLDYTRKPAQTAAQPILRQSGFWIIQTAIAISLISLLAWLHRRRRLAEDSGYAEKIQVKRERSLAIKATRQADEAATFYTQAQRAIRLSVSARSGRNFRNASRGELSIFMRQAGLNEDVIQSTEKIFTTADALRFGGSATAADLSVAKQELERILKAL